MAETPLLDPAAQEEFAREVAARRAAVAFPNSTQQTGLRGVTAQPASTTPSVPAVQPASTSPEDRQVNAAEARVNKVQNSEPATSKLMDASKGIGSNPDSFMGRHPGIARIARPFAEIGSGVLRGVETAANIAAPGIMANIPGTQFNRAVQLTGAKSDLSQAEKNRTEAAQAENLQSEAAKNKKAASGDNNIDKYDLKEVKDTRKDSPTFGQNVWAGVNKTDPTDVRFTGQQTATPPGAEKTAPLTADTARPFVDMLHTIPAQILAQVPETAKGETVQQKTARIEKSLVGMTPDEAKESLNQLRQTGTWQATREATKAQQDATAAEHKREFNQNASRKDIATHDKTYVVPATATEKSYQMFENAYSQKDNATTGAQSMLALSTHLATTFGNVKGSRVTKDMIEHHLGARSVSDSALVAVQKFTNGDVLSPQQWDAFRQLIGESREQTWDTAVREAARKNIPVDFLPEGLSAVRLGNHPATAIPTENLAAFLKKHPDGEQLSDR
jgi:hypothetical protein